MENHRINEMAFSKSDVELKISDRSADLCEHILKCVVYKDTTGNFYHWFHDEICPKLEYVSSLEVKTKSGKLKEGVYNNILFRAAGDSVRDSKSNLLEFRMNNMSKQQYPDFRVTDRLAEYLYDTISQVREIVCPMLAERKAYTSDEFYDRLFHTFSNIV